MIKKLRSHLPAGARLALLSVAAIAVLAPTSAATSPDNARTTLQRVGAVYTQTNSPAGNAVVVFDRFANGILRKRATVSTGGRGSTQSVGCGPNCPILDSQNAVVVSDNGRWVFAVNAGSDTVTSFRVTRTGLARVSHVSSGGDMPESLATHGNLLYVLNVATQNANGTTGNVYGYRVAANGRLSPVGSSRTLANAAPPDRSADPRGIEFNPTGRVLVATELAGGFMGPGPPGRIDTFVIGSNGRAGPAVSHPSSSPFPFGFAFDNRGYLVVSNIVNPMNPTQIGSVSTYRVSNAGGVTPIDTKPSGGILPCWVVVTNDNRYAYIVNTGAGHPAPVTRFRLANNGRLTALSPAAPSLQGEFARTDAALSRDSRYLYVLAPSVGPGAPSHIDAYQRRANGTLRLIQRTAAGANLGVGASGLAAR